MIYQIALAVTVIILFFALLWCGSFYYAREEAREEAVDLREELGKLDESWKYRHKLDVETARTKLDEERGERARERDELARKAADFQRCFESTEKERDNYKKAKAENDERFMTERDEARTKYTEALSRITDLDNLVCRIENAPHPDSIKGSYRITSIRGPYKKTRERLARRADRAGRKAKAS